MKETTREKLTANVRVFLMIIMVTFVCVIPCIHSLIRVWGDLMSMTDNLQFTLPLASMVMKLVIMWNKKAALAPILYNMIAKDWLRLKSDEERRIMIRCARIPRMIIICGFVFMFLSFILLFILPCFGINMRYMTNVTDPGKPLPLQTYYFYDTDVSPYFELTFVAQGVTLMVAAMGYTAIDSLFGLLVFHVCGQLQNLRGRLTGPDKNPNFDRLLADVIKDHVRLIRCVNVIENTFTLMLLGLFLYFGTLFSLYGFLLVTVFTEGLEMSVVRLMFLVTVVINIFAHMCLYCAVGEFLIAQCEGVYRAVCEYHWYELEPKKARSLILFMMRTNKPLYITVGKIFPLTMNAFCSLLKTSAGYISVLLARCD